MKPSVLALKDLNKQTLYLQIRVTRSLRIRLAVAKYLFALGAAVIGCKVEFV